MPGRSRRSARARPPCSQPRRSVAATPRASPSSEPASTVGPRPGVSRPRPAGLDLGPRSGPRPRRGGSSSARAWRRRWPPRSRRPARHRHARPCLLIAEGSLRAGQHVSLMGADGPGKAEIAPAELARGRTAAERGAGQPGRLVRLFCDEWEQASHSGDLSGAVAAGLIGPEDVTQLGAVLAGEARGRRSRRDHRLRLDRPRDPGPRDRARLPRAPGELGLEVLML